MWTMTSRDYIKSAIENLDKQLRKGGDIYQKEPEPKCLLIITLELMVLPN